MLAEIGGARGVGPAEKPACWGRLIRLAHSPTAPGPSRPSRRPQQRC